MENFHLPVFTQEKPESPNEAETIERTVEKPLKAFLRQRYPFSKDGEVLRERIRRATDEGDTSELEECRRLAPTVENPRMELFEDFKLSSEESQQVLFRDLENIQVSKGCRHQCSFCAAEAGRKVEMMPFAAILKIAEIRRPLIQRKLEAWQAWVSIMKEKVGVDVMSGSYSMSAERRQILRKEFEDFPDRDILRVAQESSCRSFNGGDHPMDWEFEVKRQMENYYDSDPFDYRDSTFLHEDGTVADYGDVFIALASTVNPIHITTAGWPMADKVAQRAAEKIVAACEKQPDILSHPRISVNKYEATARRDLEKYMRDVENVIRTLNPLKPEVMFYFEKDNPEDAEFVEKVVTPLQNILTQISAPRYWNKRGYQTSKYSGPMANASYQDDHHDVMACMPGVHLWPDGTIARQTDREWIPNKKDSTSKSLIVPKGSRPSPTGQRLFTLTDKAD